MKNCLHTLHMDGRTVAWHVIRSMLLTKMLKLSKQCQLN